MTVPEPSTHVVLVRHGEADCNVRSLIGGHLGCTGLSPLGVAQAEALRARWEATGEMRGASAFYASVLPRAIQTAESVAPAILWVDEIDKAFTGTHGSGGNDGGTSARVFTRLSRNSLNKIWPAESTRPKNAPSSAQSPISRR